MHTHLVGQSVLKTLLQPCGWLYAAVQVLVQRWFI